jgi:mono/diheme cytochrome c family protein
VKYFFLGILATIAILCIGSYLYLTLGFAGVRADLAPAKWETALMTRAVRASVNREAPELANPIAPTDENLIAGAKIYLAGCSGCHGTPGKPNPNGGQELFPPVPQLPEVGSQLTEAQIFWVTKHGIRRSGMFANGFWTSDEDMWRAATYIRRIKSLPIPVQSAVAQLVAAQH